MNLRITSIKLILASILIVVLQACGGQNIAKKASSSDGVSIGKQVSDIPKRTLGVYQDSNDNYWFIKNDLGAFRYDGETLTLYSTEDGLAANNVIAMQEDKLGNLYFDTTKGVNKFDGNSFSTIPVSDSKNNWKLEADELWFNTAIDEDGPFRYDGEKLHRVELPETEIVEQFYSKYPGASYSPLVIYSTYKDQGGNMWFGTSSAGLFRYNGKTIDWLYEEQLQSTPGGGDFGMRSIIQDDEGHFWFNNTHYKYEILNEDLIVNTTQALSYNRKEGISSGGIDDDEFPYFMSVAKTKNGDLWMATYDDGVWQNDGEKMTHFPVKNGDLSVLLFTIFKDNDDVLWLGTHNDGVYKFDGEAFHKVVF